jgi:hypothetical protein
MVNQDPEPKILTAQADFAVGPIALCPAGAVAANTSQVVTLFTNQANNEQCTFYGFAVDVIGLDGNGAAINSSNWAAGTATNPYFYQPQAACGASNGGVFSDFIVNFSVGGNSIPTNTIELQRLLLPSPNNNRSISFSSPILVLYQQPLQITITNQAIIQPATFGNQVAPADDIRTVRVKITLFGENEIQKTIYA